MSKPLKSAAALLLALAMAVSLCAAALAYEPAEGARKAEALHTLNLLEGTGDGYALEQPLTRMEALILLVRLSGSESEALYGTETYTHPFTDAPTWENADKYLAYAYTTGLARGVSDTEFDPSAPADARMFVTFVLRALGYTDGDSGTVWDNWETLARENDLLPAGAAASPFLRGDAVLVSYAALSAPVQGADRTLREQLMNRHIFSELSWATAEAILGRQADADSPLIDILGSLYAAAGDAGVYPAGLSATAITKENLSYYLGVDDLPFTEGLACEPMMSSVAHSVCLVRLEEGADVEQAKRDIRENVNPRKWICVGVAEENVRVESVGSLILLVMDNTAPDALTQPFLALAK